MKYKLLVLLILSFLITNKVSAELISIVSYNVGSNGAIVALVERKLSIRDKVALAFPDEPRMLDIVECESHFRQFKANGKVLKSPTSDYGIMQIHAPVWGKEAKKLGLDIYNSVDDNIKMGRIVYEQSGLKAWTCTKKI